MNKTWSFSNMILSHDIEDARYSYGPAIIDEAGDNSEITSLRELFNTDDRSDIMDAYNDSLLQYAM